MKKYRFENPVELRAGVPTPHFEDRRVVMRAQRVVPLDLIRLQVRRRRMLFLGGAFAIALVLGAASALVAVQFKRLSAPAELSQIAEPDVTTAAAIQVDPAPESTVIEEAPMPASPRPTITAPKRQEPLAQRPRLVNPDRDPRAVQPSEHEQLEQIREAILYEQWQERRARRAARRERRNRDGDRDLSRVDELFEGTRRRDRP